MEKNKKKNTNRKKSTTKKTTSSKKPTTRKTTSVKTVNRKTTSNKTTTKKPSNIKKTVTNKSNTVIKKNINNDSFINKSTSTSEKPVVNTINTTKVVKNKKKKVLKLKKSGLLIIILLIGIIFLINNKSNSSNKEEKHEEDQKEEIKEPVVEETELTLIMVGDCLIHGAIYADVKRDTGSYDFHNLISLISPVIKEYDLAFYNQESILGGTELGLSSYPRFNSPKEVGDAFLDAGFNLVSLANNHSLDMGEKGIRSSLDYWRSKEEQGIMTAGSYSSFEDRDRIVIMEKNGITYALLSYTTTTNGLSRPSGKEYLVNVYNEEQVKQDVERLRDKVDLLMVAMHWGEEYTHTPVSEEVEIANYLASLGVDIVIGHHPHVIQPVDFIGKTMVIYSLGNFVASQYGVEKITGLMMSVKVHKKTVDGVSEITLEEPTAQLSYVDSVIGNYRHSYKMYTYDMLDDSILKNYKSYYDKFMGIVTKYSDKISYKSL